MERVDCESITQALIRSLDNLLSGPNRALNAGFENELFTAVCARNDYLNILLSAVPEVPLEQRLLNLIADCGPLNCC